MNKIAALKKQMKESKEIGIPVNYFFDLIEGNDDLLSQGHVLVKDLNEHIDLSLVIQIMPKQISDFLKKPVKMLGFKFYHIAKEHFYHGSCMLQGIPVPVLILYCSDFHLGIISLSDVKGNVNYFRFSLKAPGHNLNIH